MDANGSKKKKYKKWYSSKIGSHRKPVISLVETESYNDGPDVTAHKPTGFYSATRWMMMGARMMGLLSLSGLNTHSRRLRFTLWSPYTILYVVSLAGQIFMCVMTVNWLIRSKYSLKFVNSVMVSTLSAVLHLIMGNIGRTWPKLIMKMEEIERNLPPIKRNIPLICNITSVLIPLSTLIQHVLRLWVHINIAIFCTKTDALHFFLTDKPWIFSYITPAWWKALLVQIIPIQTLFLMAGNDLVICVASIYLAERFETHYQLLKKASKEDQLFSCDEFQTQYSQIACLVKLLNDKFGICTFISFGGNLFLICKQLYYSLSKNESVKYVLCNPKDVNSQRF